MLRNLESPHQTGPSRRRALGGLFIPRGTLALYPYLFQGAVFSAVAVASSLASYLFLPLALGAVLAAYLLLVATLRRLSDMGRTWFWMLLMVPPFIGPFLMCFAVVGTTATAPPRPEPLFRFPFAVSMVFLYQTAFFFSLVLFGFASDGNDSLPL
jgi:uncharacterized membrane protein YhaH (DUF805 family)